MVMPVRRVIRREVVQEMPVHSLANLATHAGEEIERRLILLSWNKLRQHAAKAPSLGNLSQPGQHVMFNLSAKSAAAQQQRVNRYRGILSRIENGADQPIVTKA